MAGSKRIVVALKSGTLVEAVARKPNAPRSKNKWLAACASAALQSRGRRYAVRMGGNWEVYGVDYPHAIKVFRTEDSAAMWLALHPGFDT